MSGRRSALAMLGAGVASTAVLVSLPVLAAGMAAQVGGGAETLGLLAAADMAGSALSSLLVIKRVRQLDWRVTARAALALMTIGNALSAFATGFWMLAILRMAVGAGSGLVVALTFIGLCHSGNAERYFGLYVFAQLVLQALLMALFSGLLASSGIGPVYAVLAAISAASVLLVRDFPVSAAAHGIGVSGPSAVEPANSAGRVGLAGLAAYFVAAGIVWAYFEPVGRAFGLDAASVGTVLGGSAVAGMAGAALVILLAARFGRTLGLAIGTSLSVASVALLMVGSAAGTFVVAAAVFTFAWNFTFPYQMGLLAALDRSGEIAVSALVVQLVALAAGPLFAAGLVTGGRELPLLGVGVGLFVASAALFAGAARLGRTT